MFADFLRMYSGYTRKTALEEYAATFFMLVYEGYKAENKNYLMLYNLLALDGAEENSRKKFLKKLEWASQDLSDILKPSTEGSSTEDINRVLGG